MDLDSNKHSLGASAGSCHVNASSSPYRECAAHLCRGLCMHRYRWAERVRVAANDVESKPMETGRRVNTMSGMAFVALAAIGLWMALLTIVSILAIRQIGLLTIRLDVALAHAGRDIANAGPLLGSEVPSAAVSILPELRVEHRIVLLLSAGCAPCQSLAADLGSQPLVDSTTVIALVPGDNAQAQKLIYALPNDIQSIRDPVAGELTTIFQLTTSPFVVEIRDGKITRKSVVAQAVDLRDFLVLDSAESFVQTRHATVRQEVVSHAG